MSRVPQRKRGQSPLFLYLFAPSSLLSDQALLHRLWLLHHRFLLLNRLLLLLLLLRLLLLLGLLLRLPLLLSLFLTVRSRGGPLPHDSAGTGSSSSSDRSANCSSNRPCYRRACNGARGRAPVSTRAGSSALTRGAPHLLPCLFAVFLALLFAFPAFLSAFFPVLRVSGQAGPGQAKGNGNRACFQHN